ncbi:MAG: MgtC/SapB family protein [Planctomycetes bacterium]|nr:MgtC/SapB family protein [Planctomycetota bacterium]
MSDPVPHQDLLNFIWQILLSGALGMTIGLERERVGHEDPHRPQFAGLRTFGLAAVIGCLSALVAAATHGAVLAVAFLCLGILSAVSYFTDVQRDKGVTTEVTFLLTFLIGVTVHLGLYLQASALTLGVVAVLTYKPALHGFAARVNREDISNALKFGLVSIVILPLLPNRTFDPWGALNPYVVWWMVVLMSGISFAGYILVKVVGPRAGIGLTGLLGGLVSSTAVTLTFTQRSREEAGAALARPYAMAVVTACTILYPRVLLAIGVLNPTFAWDVGPLLLASLLLGLAIAGVLYRHSGEAPADGPSQAVVLKNPFELLPAIKFAAIFAVVAVILKLARGWFGDAGLYFAAAVAGFTDVDAIALSMARAVAVGSIPSDLAARCVLIATVSNTCVKAGIVIAGGAPAFRRPAGTALALLALGTAALLAASWLF